MSKKYVFIKAQSNDSKFWSNIYNGMNLMNVGTDKNPKLADTPNQIDTFTRREMRPSIALSTNPESEEALQFGYRAFATLNEDIAAGIKTEMMIDALDAMDYPHAFVSFGYLFDEPNTEAVPTDKIITGSVYFGRDKDGKIINIATGREIQANWDEDVHKFALWYTMLKVSNDMYYLVVNPDLANIYENIETEENNIVYSVIDTHDGTLCNTILKPAFSREAKELSDNIVTVSKAFKVDPYRNSVFGFRYTDYDKSAIDLRIESNLEFKVEEDSTISFKAPKKGELGYIYFRIPVASDIIDQYSQGTDSIRKSYIVLKA